LKTSEYFISCDWGTSNFRLRLVETLSLNVIKEVKAREGIKKLNQNLGQKDRLTFFADYLGSKINELPENHRKHSVIISGMASSSIGMMDLQYATMPIKITGEGLFSKEFKTNSGLDVILISGIRSESSIMRGEEIQAVGLADLVKEAESGYLILPGTHSKHIQFGNGVFRDFKTFMTGELFQLLAEQSILSASITKDSINDKTESSFLTGVQLGLKGKLSENLFSVRVNSISNKLTNEENYFYLSGLIIGDELSYLMGTLENVILAASEPVFSLYKLALSLVSSKKKPIFCNAESLERAMLEGHKKMLLQYGH